MGKKLFVVVLFLLTILVSACVKVNDFNQERSYLGADVTYSSSSISDLNNLNNVTGSYNVEGHVVKIYTCPSCPKGAMCKLCMPDNIIISENNVLLDSYSSVSSSEVMLLVNNPNQFELGERYRFSLKLTNHKSADGDIFNIFELVGYDSLN